jgi:hypothetical protein
MTRPAGFPKTNSPGNKGGNSLEPKPDQVNRYFKCLLLLRLILDPICDQKLRPDSDTDA